MLQAGAKLDPADKGCELTQAGRALQKHRLGSRKVSAFPAAAGNPAELNKQGQKVLEDILGSNNQLITPNRFGGRNIFDANTGRGVGFNAAGEMVGFLEP